VKNGETNVISRQTASNARDQVKDQPMPASVRAIKPERCPSSPSREYAIPAAPAMVAPHTHARIVDLVYEEQVYDDDDDDDDDDNVSAIPAGNYNDWPGFQVSGSMPRCDERKHSLGDLMLLLGVPNGIDLCPEHQRGFVWTEENQIGLINSIFQGYYVPSLIFNKRVEIIFGNVRKEVLVCLDGKQRLTSVKRFTDGQIPCHDRYGQKWYFRQAGKPVRCRSYLPQAVQAEFLRRTFTCHEYVGMSEEQERDLFQRVQRGSPLTIAEKAQATKGQWQELARSFQKDFPRVLECESRRLITHITTMSFANQFQSDQQRPRSRM
jgi:hypothetical protein